MKKNRRLLYEGKAKAIYEGPKENTIIQFFKDDLTAFNSKKHQIMNNKGVINNLICEHIFTALNKINIPTHFIKRLNEREQLVRKVQVVPLEIVIRNITAGSLVKRLDLKEGEFLPNPLIEFYYKSDRLDDPPVSGEHILTFKWASEKELNDIKLHSLRINDFLCGLFLGINIQLVDFKLEFGRFRNKKEELIILCDEISPDSCRLWDVKTKEKFDKDRFRYDMGEVIKSYCEVANRLGIKDENLEND